MPKTKTTAQAVVVSPEERLKLLDGFADVVHELCGYKVARKLKLQEMADATKDESKNVREISKAVSKNIEAYIEEPTNETKTEILSKRKELKSAKETLKEARKPFMGKISPLAKAVRYMESVVLPDSLKELGKPITPMFSLSDWVNDALEATKKKK